MSNTKLANGRKRNIPLTPVSRLSRAPKTPLKMVGDPEWFGHGLHGYANRERLVYEHMMVIKRGGWTDALWNLANRHNEYIDALLARKWRDYDLAMDEIKFWDYDEAQRENAAWDYHHEYAVDGDWRAFQEQEMADA